MMRVTLFGTRGSIPSPGPETIRYGGNTSAVEVRVDRRILVLDAGTGIRRLGAQLPPGIRRIDILLTHLHLDHIEGLGFFGPLYHPAIDVHIWGPANRKRSLDARLTRYLSPPFFPVHLQDLPSLTFHDLPWRSFDIGPFNVRASLVCHPDPTVGYRIQSEGNVLAYLPDHEPALGLRDSEWLEPNWTSGYDLAANADLLIHDAQYTDEEYAQRIGWGHSTYRHAFEFAAHVGAKILVPFHHDPSHDDDMLDRLTERALSLFKPSFAVTSGYEGATFDIGRNR